MFSKRVVNHNFIRFYEKIFRGLLNDESLKFKSMLFKFNDAAIHVKDIQNLKIFLTFEAAQ